jgi:hypothetical protein
MKITFIYDYKSNETWSTPLSLLNEFKERGWVNFPDVQTRIYKNSDKIGWSGKVHERIVGFESYTNFPADEIYCIIHPKTIERQERQNNYYDTL